MDFLMLAALLFSSFGRTIRRTVFVIWLNYKKYIQKLPNFNIEGATFSETCDEQKIIFQKLTSILKYAKYFSLNIFFLYSNIIIHNNIFLFLVLMVGGNVPHNATNGVIFPGVPNDYLSQQKLSPKWVLRIQTDWPIALFF